MAEEVCPGALAAKSVEKAIEVAGHPDMRAEVWRTLLHAPWTNPRALKAGVHMTSIYAHAGPFTRRVVTEIDRQIAEAPASSHSRPSTALQVVIAARPVL